jgi:ubiquinol-cytochrome c reductase cytochrome c1 subunit
MMKVLVIFLLNVLGVTTVLASDGGGFPLKHVTFNLEDRAALYRGAQTFIAQCATCHSAEYMRYGRVATDLRLSKVQADGLLPPHLKLGDEMVSFMPADYAKTVFGTVPPDLTLIARVRGADWLYTYLTSFYADPTKRWGVNNAVFPGVNMPDVFAALQGVQEPVYTTVKLPDGSSEQRLAGLKPPLIPGSMSPAEFDTLVRDLVAYMVYMSEPAKMQRMSYGPYVLGFILLFTVLMYLLKIDYWRDIKKPVKAD